MINLLPAIIPILLLLMIIEEGSIFGICRYMNGPGKFEKSLAAGLKQAKQKFSEKI
ncbi:hypothetical protein [Bacillus sp. OG2]|uniref:hypothetical protein n=1 Tax=Bacillus infantis TaxID=324767 RepID=UPI0014824A05